MNDNIIIIIIITQIEELSIEIEFFVRILKFSNFED